jgi:molybdopterin/thiamine biosynthesis adenylyltransferase/rhodanese-related sulfurtransferase
MNDIRNTDFSRYQRQMILPQIGGNGQEKLRKAKVIVIGAGGLGSPVLMYLAAAGIGTIGVIEYDKVDLSNLHRQILYNTSDIGKNKIEVTTQRLNRINPGINLIPYNEQLSKNNVLEIIKDYDVVIDGSDNFPTRFMVNDATVILDKPLVFGAAYQFIGQASVFNYKNGPTYRCVFPEQPKAGEMPSCSTGGVIGPLPGIIGSIQANETIKIILDIGESLSGRFLQINSLDFNIDIINVEPDLKQKKIKSLGVYEISCESQINNITPTELLNERTTSKIKIYEVRSQQQYNEFNIGGERIEAEELLQNTSSFSIYEKVVIACQKGIQSLSVIEQILKKENLNNIYNLEGGISRWLKEIDN